MPGPLLSWLGTAQTKLLEPFAEPAGTRLLSLSPGGVSGCRTMGFGEEVGGFPAVPFYPFLLCFAQLLCADVCTNLDSLAPSKPSVIESVDSKIWAIFLCEIVPGSCSMPDTSLAIKKNVSEGWGYS